MAQQQALAAAMQRVESVLRRRPELGAHDDDPATAHWDGAARVLARHQNGTELLTDMPREIGGGGEAVTPGWLLRAALASCAVTRIAMAAAAQGVELQSLDVQALSRSDTRGLLGMDDGHGQPVTAAPGKLQLRVRIRADGVAPERLEALVRDGCRHASVSRAMDTALPVAMHIEVQTDTGEAD